MERAGKLKPQLAGTMTFLPIAETLQGDITGYIPSNLISMTDGQIYMNTNLFQEGLSRLSIWSCRYRVSAVKSNARQYGPSARAAVCVFTIPFAFAPYAFKDKTVFGSYSAASKGAVLHEIFIQENNAPVLW